MQQTVTFEMVSRFQGLCPSSNLLGVKVWSKNSKSTNNQKGLCLTMVRIPENVSLLTNILWHLAKINFHF